MVCSRTARAIRTLRGSLPGSGARSAAPKPAVRKPARTICHGHPSVDLPTGAMTGSAQGLEEKALVDIVTENPPTAVPAGHQAVKSTWIFDAHTTCHAPNTLG